MKKQNAAKIALAILAILIVASTLVLLGNSVVIKSSIEATPLSPAKDYGDIMQYEWTTGEANENQTGFSAGPGPDRPDILWKVTTSGSGYISVFNGKAFVLSGNTLKAYDAFTGSPVWNTTLLRSAAGSGGTTKIDDTYLFVDCNGPEVRKISDGSFVSNYTVPYWGGMGGGAQYFPGAWSSTLKMKYGLSFDNIETKKGYVNAISLADPTKPVLAWNYTVQDASEISTYGVGKLLVGTTAGVVYALDGRNGTFLWRAPKTGVAQQHGFCYDGNFYESASSQTMTCWDGDTGQVLWEYDLTGNLGTRAFTAYNGAAGYGRVYTNNDAVDPHGWVICFDAKTGELLWKQPGYYRISYTTPAIGGGKIYTATCDSAKEAVTAGLEMPGYRFTCFDAITGTQLWSIPQQFATPSIAYGNLYGIYGGVVYCIGQTTPSSTSAKPWSFGYAGNIDQQRVAIGQSGPEDLSTPRWVFATGAKISGSPAVVDGKVYIGSEDHNWYCLDAYTGKKIWNFTTGYLVGSSAAVVGGRVYTGADDGNIYCLDANTGEKIWDRYAGGVFKNIIMPQELQSRSSPIIVGDSLYVGALDGKVYCLNTANGAVRWTYATGDAIGGSPAYSNGVIYIASTDTYLYALDAATGAFKWKSIPLNLDVYYIGNGAMSNLNYFCTPTPVIAGGTVYIAGGVTMGGLSYNVTKYRWLTNGVGPGYTSPGSANGGCMRIAAFSATTGASIWNQTLAGNSGGVWVPTYFNGILYIVEYLQMTAMNATKPDSGPVGVYGYQMQPAGNRTWKQWIGYEILSSVAYVDDLRSPKVYVGSDVGSVTCLNATNGAPVSAYQSGANIESSPTIWEGKLYIGSMDRNVYCFDDSPIVDFSINACADKGAEMWNNETIKIGGRLISNPVEMTYDYILEKYVPIASEMHPGLPNATVHVSFTKPDMSSINLTTTTDNSGYFSVSYSPTEVGDWGWVAWYPGQRTKGITYNVAYAEWSPFAVTASPSSVSPTPTPTPTPTPGGMPVEYIYAAVAIIAIVLIAIGAYAYTRRSKK